MDVSFKVLIVIVLYKCKLKESISFITLKEQLNDSIQTSFGYYIHDNSPEPDSEALEITKNNPLFFYTHDPLNSGLSVAYNNSALFARDAGCQYLLISDQDTSWDDNFINEILLAVANHPNIKLFAPILKTAKGMPVSPTRYYLKKGHCCNLLPGIYPLKKYSPVNSGLFIDLKAFLEVGGYNEKVRLDFSDFQFIERFCEKYDSFCVIPSHSIQDFSGDVVDIEKQKARYEIFCESTRMCTKNSFWDKCIYLLIVLRYAVHLACTNQNMSFFRIFHSEYLKKK